MAPTEPELSRARIECRSSTRRNGGVAVIVPAPFGEFVERHAEPCRKRFESARSQARTYAGALRTEP